MVPAEQNGHLDMADLRTALAKLPEDQREAIILVGASGFSYEEAAEICAVAIGTVKSRVNRARARLAVLLQLDSDDKSQVYSALDSAKSAHLTADHQSDQ